MNSNQNPAQFEEGQPPTTILASPVTRIRNFVRTNLVGTITVTIAGSLLLTGGSTWNMWNIYQGFQSTVTKQVNLQKNSGLSLYVGEIVSGSVRQSAATGDPKWEKRYQDNVVELDRIIKQVLADVPPDIRTEASKTDEVNLKLVAIETEVFKLVRQGKKEEGLKLLQGAEYSNLDKIYYAGTRNVLDRIDRSIKQQLEDYQQQLLISISIAAGTLPILLISWMLVLSAVRDYIRDRQAAAASLVSSQQDLLQLNQQLAEEVEIRSQQEQQIRLESELLQADIAHILDVVCAMEEGDLTVLAQVNERATGLVSDTLNRLIESLNRIISTVVDTTHTVADDASQLELMALETTQQAQSQTTEVQAVQSLMDRVNALVVESIEYGVATEAAVNEVISAVGEGRQAIEDTIDGMDTLRAGTEQIVKRTQLLTEFVDLAAQFSKDQKRVASLTRVLALNASTLSSRAVKEQNPDQFASLAKEFETIARQVNDLATDTNHSLISLQQRTDRIQTVTSGLSQDITDIDRLVQKFTQEISKSGRAFNNVQTTISQTSEFDRKVGDSHQNIMTAIRETLSAIESISTVAQVTEAKATLTREQVQSMGNLSRRLLQMVEFFKLNQLEFTPQVSSIFLPTSPDPHHSDHRQLVRG
jgi:methyl-accepting chemotaxis protein PixJ